MARTSKQLANLVSRPSAAAQAKGASAGGLATARKRKQRLAIDAGFNAEDDAVLVECLKSVAFNGKFPTEWNKDGSIKASENAVQAARMQALSMIADRRLPVPKAPILPPEVDDRTEDELLNDARAYLEENSITIEHEPQGGD